MRDDKVYGDRMPGVQKFTTPEKFIQAKLRMLRVDLRIEPTAEELAKLNAAQTECGINRVVCDIIDAHYAANDFIKPKKPGRKKKGEKT